MNGNSRYLTGLKRTKIQSTTQGNLRHIKQLVDHSL